MTADPALANLHSREARNNVACWRCGYVFVDPRESMWVPVPANTTARLRKDRFVTVRVCRSRLKCGRRA